jgi:hypothetical protein
MGPPEGQNWKKILCLLGTVKIEFFVVFVVFVVFAVFFVFIHLASA